MKRLLIASFVLAALSGAIWWSEKQEAAKQAEPDPKAAAKILTFKEADVTRLQIQLKDQPATVVSKDSAGKWTITAPTALPADQTAVQTLANALSGLTADRVIDQNLTDLPGYGLEPPAISIEVKLKDGKTSHLRVGEETPDKTGLYTSLDGDKRLFAIPAYSKDTLSKQAADLRDKHLLTFEADKVSKLELVLAGKPPIEFGKNSEQQWQIVRPKPMRADNLAVQELVSLIQGAEMDRSADDKTAASGFASAQPLGSVRVTVPSGIQTLEIRKSGMDYFAKSAIGTFKGTPNLGPGVSKSLEDFQNKKVFDFGFDDPTKITYRNKDDEKTFEKAGNDWVMNGRPMDSVSVQNMIDKLRDLAATSIADGAVSKPEMEITIVSKNGSRTEKVSIAPAGSDFTAQRDKEPSLYRIAGSAITDLRQAVSGVREAPEAKKSDNKK